MKRQSGDWRSQTVLSLRFLDFHADDLGAFEAIDVLDGAVEDYLAVEVADYLMDVHDDSAIGEGFETLGLDDGVNQVPLARPVFAHTLVAANSAAFHAVGPIYIGMQEEQQKIEIALVECVVGRLDQIFVCESWSWDCHSIIPPGNFH